MNESQWLKLINTRTLSSFRKTKNKLILASQQKKRQATTSFGTSKLNGCISVMQPKTINPFRSIQVDLRKDTLVITGTPEGVPHKHACWELWRQLSLSAFFNKAIKIEGSLIGCIKENNSNSWVNRLQIDEICPSVNSDRLNTPELCEDRILENDGKK